MTSISDEADQRQSAWPTAVRPDGTAPPSIELVGSADRLTVRQALYQMRAADILQAGGHTVRALQAPLVGARVRLTVPIVLVRTDGPDACVYTQSEPWSVERIEALRAWIRELREESDSEVIVVSREPSDSVAHLPEVGRFLHLPYEHLP